MWVAYHSMYVIGYCVERSHEPQTTQEEDRQAAACERTDLCADCQSYSRDTSYWELCADRGQSGGSSEAAGNCRMTILWCLRAATFKYHPPVLGLSPHTDPALKKPLLPQIKKTPALWLLLWGQRCHPWGDVSVLLPVKLWHAIFNYLCGQPTFTAVCLWRRTRLSECYLTQPSKTMVQNSTWVETARTAIVVIPIANTDTVQDVWQAKKHRQKQTLWFGREKWTTRSILTWTRVAISQTD